MKSPSITTDIVNGLWLEERLSDGSIRRISSVSRLSHQYSRWVDIRQIFDSLRSTEIGHCCTVVRVILQPLQAPSVWVRSFFTTRVLTLVHGGSTWYNRFYQSQSRVSVHVFSSSNTTHPNDPTISPSSALSSARHLFHSPQRRTTIVGPFLPNHNFLLLDSFSQGAN